MAGIALMGEFLVGSVETVTSVLRLTPFFVGIIIVPIIGNVAEHLAVYGILGLAFFFLPAGL